MDEATPIGAVVGANIAELRAERGWSQHRTVYELGMIGLEWSRSALSSIEAGRRRDIEVGELLLVAHAFEVPLPRLLEGEGRLALGPGLSMALGDARDALSGGETIVRVDDPQRGEEWMAEALSDADERVAHRLGADVEVVRSAAVELWGHSLTQERNRRAGIDSAADDSQRSAFGHVTRQLTKEISDYLEET